MNNNLHSKKLKSLGYFLTIVGLTILLIGIFAKFYSTISSTPDEPFYYNTIYPYEHFSPALLIIGLPTLLIGITFLYKSR
jgi:uncharacterized membrane protein